MIIPIRCFSCGKPLAHLWEEYKRRVESGEKPKDVLDSLGIKRYCCRAVFLSHIDKIDLLTKYKKA